MAKSKKGSKKILEETVELQSNDLSVPQSGVAEEQLPVEQAPVEQVSVTESSQESLSVSTSDQQLPKESEPESATNVSSVKAETHVKKRRAATTRPEKLATTQNKWVKIAGLAAGVAALLLLIVSAVSSQYFKGKTMPNVVVAGISSTAKTPSDLKRQLEAQKKEVAISFKTDDKTLQPKLEEIGYQIDVDKTVNNALSAKRRSGVWAKIAFWHQAQVPAVVTVNDTLLSQYLETNTPSLTKAPQDAQLQFDPQSATFTVTTQADGQEPNFVRLKKELTAIGNHPGKATIAVGIARKGPTITEAKLQPLLQPANDLVSRQIILTGLGYTYKAKPADIAVWITPTPQSDGSVKLVVDSAKVQSYVESIGKKISSPPRDKKIVKDSNTGGEVVLQEGRDGTELADRQNLATAIAQALKAGQNTTQTMNITTAAYKTVNMEAYDKWIEVDLSEQRTTAYERATPIKTFTVATGVRGHDTPVGEYAIWLRVRSQTMKGGSKATGDYYDIPNVEWVSYFYQDYALHGAWWRKVFGYPASHGCVNMTNDDAHWVYDWAPVGTKVIVHA